MPVRLVVFLDALRSRLWFIPGAFVVGSALLSFAIVALDRLVDQSVGDRLQGLLFAGGPDSARLVLSTIASAMLTFTGLVYTVTMLVLQLASAQLSPRVMRTFLRDRINQSVLGLFVATFLYALLVLREVRSPPEGTSFVPALAVTVAFVLLIASVAFFVVYIHHMAQSIRAASVLRSVADETRAAIERQYPTPIDEAAGPSGSASLPDRPPDEVVVMDRAPGVITTVDEDALVAQAEEHRLTVEVPYTVGDFVPTGAPLLRVWRAGGADPERELPRRLLTGAIQTGRERTMTEDVAFGFRQIVDVAERALSPGVNDPTTAVQSLDELHDLLRRLAVREIPGALRRSDDGTLLLRIPRSTWDDYVALALDEIRQYGAGSVQVTRRLRYLLGDLRGMAPASRRAAIDRQLRLLDAGAERAFPLEEDRRAAAGASPSGQGPSETPPDLAS